MIPRALAIAASDSSGAAGLQADLKTFAARRVYGMAALTALTAQDSLQIAAFQRVPPEFVAQQIRVVLADLGADAIKCGLLLSAEVIAAVAESVPPEAPNLVVDPVLVDGKGRLIVAPEALEAYKRLLFPRARLITPNLEEARLLTGLPLTRPEALPEAARLLAAFGARAVLIKGGHAESEAIHDVLWEADQLTVLTSPRLAAHNPRGAGCTFAACITAELAHGRDLRTAVQTAQAYVREALQAAMTWRLGKGERAVLDHGAPHLP
ncbi:MAG: bifunctional hydroxymethylpyrimidine kinase/phosphomethylpyrimidine kinase [Candidatus Thermofonsia Clade 1 bacterium]|jgi:hydroxymethylpyrimidine/phosphomethylpyrimidine kinase|uniref:Bifunctional hydroxymethylpyrimidine kinase/phosphomethylpyrimidine kinase n=1 Tax=Candidatus Thermofonsia Clade 1 bacterium TaxID=2364210 RepID=A0A2M8PDN8_9CHLR|nr:MAG: bifunctional hydroxymethylpyrimidine kinase/phosphomethylpyrimidine kinase [Candidatus Thermofonsia Clade 1 bacterium]RMF53485.1 MAG: bifunctional hydroxymethylpyrimidine kinase/phosphomethylpyrimidine kinase [Chloroflexota bacterium]